MIDRLPLQLRPLAWWLAARYGAASDAEGGVSVVEWVIIASVVAALAIVVGAIIVSKVTTKANNINLNGNG